MTRVRAGAYDKVAGTVRFFNGEHYYGFLNATEPVIPEGVYVGGKVVSEFRASNGGLFVTGARCVLGDVVLGTPTYAATRIIYSSATETLLSGEHHATGKWFKTQIGYGFVVLECGAQAFLRADTVRQCMDINLLTPFNQNPFLVKLDLGPKGLHVTEIRKP